ncbi:hypothetical protein HNY73_009442 [Argiope bruennichi]|uniref:Uncharacterized protein n=1 Tax=Argiope bruennichi TaxID=94029 RepID=A0A8T0FF48_ARGBR|nr:hypothetical protein HNY73_009442 [Argiope bruennichi]
MGGQWKVILSAVFLVIAYGTVSASRVKRQNEEMSEIEKILENPISEKFLASWKNPGTKISKMSPMMKKLMPMVIRSSSSVELSGPCMSAMFKMLMGMRQGKLWPYLSKDFKLYFLDIF